MPPFRQARLAGPSTRAGTMSTFTLGHVQVRRSGYGAMQLADPYAFGPPPDRASAIGVLRAAVAAGVDHIDTAQYHGVVNDLIREALYPYAVTCLPGELSQPRRDRVPSRSADAPSPAAWARQSSQPLDEAMTSRTRSRCVQPSFMLSTPVGSDRLCK
jgi:Aldo/keto reductase family